MAVQAQGLKCRKLTPAGCIPYSSAAAQFKCITCSFLQKLKYSVNKFGFSNFCPHENKGMSHLLDQLWLKHVVGYHNTTTGRWGRGCSNWVVLETTPPKKSSLLWKLCFILSQPHKTYLIVNGDETSSGGDGWTGKICPINKHCGPSRYMNCDSGLLCGHNLGLRFYWPNMKVRVSTTASSAFLLDFLFPVQGFNF